MRTPAGFIHTLCYVFYYLFHYIAILDMYVYIKYKKYGIETISLLSSNNNYDLFLLSQ